MPKIDISIIIVYYSGKEKLQECLQSIKKHKTHFTYELIVVNNGKDDIKGEIKKIIPKIIYIKSVKNGGYGYGNNLGANNAHGKYLFILNPDTVILPRTLDILIPFLEKNKNIVIAAPLLIDEKGKAFKLQGTQDLTPVRAIFSLSFLNKIFPNNQISRKYWLLNTNLNVIREVGTVPGTAFIIQKNVFEKVGKFDEKMFLFFEEADLGKRVQDAGYKIMMNPDAKVIHYWKNKKKGDEKMSEIAAKSRFYYFKKHYGIVNALLVEVFTRFSKWTALAFAVIMLGATLRLWKLTELMYLFPDAGWYYISARDMLLTGKIPLVGIASSVPVLHQGALWTWILGCALWIGNFNPIVGVYLAVTISVTAIVLTYFVVSSIFNKSIGIVASLFTAISPFIVFHDRIPYQTVPINLLTLLIAWYSYEITIGKDRYFLLGILFAIIFQFELAGFIMIIIVLMTLVWHRMTGDQIVTLGLPRINSEFQRIGKLGAGIFWGLLPFLIYDLKNGVFIQTIGFLAWFLTKIYEEITGVFQPHVSNSINSSDGLQMIRSLVFPWNERIAVVLVAFFFVYVLLKYIKGKERPFAYKLVLAWFSIGFASFFIRGTFSEAYIPFVYFPVACCLGIAVTDLLKKSKIITAILALSYFSTLGYYAVTNLAQENYVSYPKRLEVANAIITDANGGKYTLHYLGPTYMYESGDTVWKYVLWWKGNEPVQSADLQYTIIEYPYELVGKFNEVVDFGNVKIGVKKGND